ncbi:hypothetical protein LINGRAHAP2_LOCUS30923 [Linum grandiflorum]
MAELSPILEWQFRQCDCKVPVRQRVISLGPRFQRVFLECQEWEYSKGCYFCEWVEIREGTIVDGGILKSGSFMEMQIISATSQSIKLALVADELNKRMEEIVETMKIVNIRAAVASGKSRILLD